MTVKVYERNLKKDSSYGLSESIKTEINNQAIIPILSDSIYKDPLSAIRELYSNEITSCKLSSLQTRIEIKLNASTRELIIQGFNSMGLTREVFDKILTVMGNTGNNNSKNSGYFGLGFFSHVKLSEKLICHSYSQTNERFSFISKSGLSFEILPENLIEKLDQFGTKMILNVNDEIDIDKLISKIEQIIEFSPIETKFILDENEIIINQVKSLKEKMKNDFNKILSKKYSSTSLKIYQASNEFYDLVIVQKFPIQYHENKNHSYLLQVPINIDFNEIIDDYTIKSCNVYLNIKDEREFIPHVSRDYLTSQSESKLIKLFMIDLENFKKYNPHFILKDGKISITEFYNDNFRLFKTDNLGSFYVKSLVNKKSSNFTTQFIETIDKLENNYIINGICFLDNYNAKIMRELFDLGYLCFCQIIRSLYRANELFYDITDIQTIFKKNNIKSKIGITHIIKSNSRVFKRSSNPCFIFKVDDPKTKVSYSNDELGFSYLTSKKPNHLKISDIKDILKDEIFLTNNGYLSIEQLQKPSNIYLCEDGLYHNFCKLFENNRLVIYNFNRLNAQLLALYFDVDLSYVNNYSGYFCRYKFKNENLKKLFAGSIINKGNISNYADLKNILDLDNSFDIGAI